MAISSSKFTSMGSPWEQIRNVTLAGGPAFDLKGGSSPIREFNVKLMGMLKQYQKFGTADWQRMALRGENEQAKEQ